MTSTETRSITVAPAISALCRISTGTHLPSMPNTGSTVASPGSAARSSPSARTLPAGAWPRPASTPAIRTA
ncbi:Uncharacterised protein [Mycobacteroides abscessus]|nr:Uncharacterised protein [Mycobacteroides abscessus]